MIVFDPQDLFPLLGPETHTYPEAQTHSAQVDDHLGFQFETIEENLQGTQTYQNAENDVQAWQGLPVQSLQTPYTEIRYILHLLNLKPNETVVDLGCGYGRMAHVIGTHYPEVHFTGYELVAERVQEGVRVINMFEYPRVKLKTQDLSAADFTPVKAQYYFIFDFGSRAAIEKTLQDLRQIAQQAPITVIARGRGIRHQIYRTEPWLSEINPPETHPHFTIFRS